MEKIIEDFLALVKIGAASGDERGVADYVKDLLTDLGCDVIEDRAGEQFGGNTGNLIVKLSGSLTAEPLLFSAHLDRVANGYHVKPQMTHEYITSDGTTILAADNIAGVVSIIDGIRRTLASGKAYRTTEVLLSVAEEKGLLGSKYADLSQFKSRKAYVLDSPGRIGRLNVSAPTKERYDIIVKGKAAHAGNEPEKGINALRVAAHALSLIPDGRLAPDTTANAGIIKGGQATNIVCDSVFISGEIRSRRPAQIELFKRHVAEAFQTAATHFEAPMADITWVKYYDGFEVDPSDSICLTAVRHLEKLGVDVTFLNGGGGMDANRLNAAGIQAIGVSTGYSQNHTSNEKIYLEDLLKSGQFVANLMQDVGQ